MSEWWSGEGDSRAQRNEASSLCPYVRQVALHLVPTSTMLLSLPRHSHPAAPLPAGPSWPPCQHAPADPAPQAASPSWPTPAGMPHRSPPCQHAPPPHRGSLRPGASCRLSSAYRRFSDSLMLKGLRPTCSQFSKECFNACVGWCCAAVCSRRLSGSSLMLKGSRTTW